MAVPADITTKLNTIISNITDAYVAIQDKGGSQGVGTSGLVSAIESIPETADPTEDFQSISQSLSNIIGE